LPESTIIWMIWADKAVTLIGIIIPFKKLAI